MYKPVVLLIVLLAISVPTYAQVGGFGGGRGGSVTVQEEDGNPTGTASTLKFPNGTVTNNGSGSFSVSATGSPSDATYITQTANGSLSAEQALGALSTGCLVLRPLQVSSPLAPLLARPIKLQSQMATVAATQPSLSQQTLPSPALSAPPPLRLQVPVRVLCK